MSETPDDLGGDLGGLRPDDPMATAPPLGPLTGRDLRLMGSNSWPLVHLVPWLRKPTPAEVREAIRLLDRRL